MTACFHFFEIHRFDVQKATTTVYKQNQKIIEFYVDWCTKSSNKYKILSVNEIIIHFI